MNKPVGDNTYWSEQVGEEGFVEIHMGVLWNSVTSKYRAELLNKSSSVDLDTKNLTELADFINKASELRWLQLPDQLREQLENEFVAVFKVVNPGEGLAGFYDR